MSKSQFKTYIELKINQKQFCELSDSTKSKVEKVKRTINVDKHFKIQMQPYLKTNIISTSHKQALFSLRNRTYNLKCNYRTMHENDIGCRSCQEDESIENEIHVFEQCIYLHNAFVSDNNIKFEHIFGTLDQQINAINYFLPIMNKRDIELEILENR